MRGEGGVSSKLRGMWSKPYCRSLFATGSVPDSGGRNFPWKELFCLNLFYIEMAAVVVGQSWRNLIQRRTSLEISLTGKLPTEFLMVVVVISIKRLMIMKSWSSFETLATNWLLWKNPPTSLKTKKISNTFVVCLKRWHCKYKFKHVQKSQIV